MAADPAGWDTKSLAGAAKTVHNCTDSKDFDTLEILQPPWQLMHLLYYVFRVAMSHPLRSSSMPVENFSCAYLKFVVSLVDIYRRFV